MPIMTAKRVFCGLKKQHQRVVWMLQIHEKEAAQAGWIFADTVLLRNSLPSGFGFQTGRHCLGINYRSCCWAAVMSAIISLFQLLWKMRINCVVLIAFGRLYKRYRLWAILWLFVGHWCACISIIRVTLLFRPPDSCHLCHVFLIKLLFQVSFHCIEYLFKFDINITLNYHRDPIFMRPTHAPKSLQSTQVYMYL